MSKKGCLHCNAINPCQADKCHSCGYSFYNTHADSFDAGFRHAIKLLCGIEARRYYRSERDISSLEWADWLEEQRSYTNE